VTSSGPQRGITYLALLFALALIGLALGAAGTVWSVQKQREREQELLWVGGQFRQAVASYYATTPLGIHQYPQQFDELLEDKRGPVMQRHLRRIYNDPMTGTNDWEMIRLGDGALLGVASKAQGRPLKQAGFDDQNQFLADAACYCDWRFVYLPRLPGSASPQLRKGS
jgi:type II secretory pathway pseudopilin PulG